MIISVQYILTLILLEFYRKLQYNIGQRMLYEMVNYADVPDWAYL